MSAFTHAQRSTRRSRCIGRILHLGTNDLTHSLPPSCRRNHAIENNNKYYDIIFYLLSLFPSLIPDRAISVSRISRCSLKHPREKCVLSPSIIAIVLFYLITYFPIPPSSDIYTLTYKYTSNIYFSLALSLFSVPKITEAYNAPRCMV